jgi:hypothetical protein
MGTISWCEEEVEKSGLADERLRRRLRVLLERMGSAVGESIPMACQDWASTKAAYRFLSNDRISEAGILAGHFCATASRVKATTGFVLLLQDTTEFSYQRARPDLIGVMHKLNCGKSKYSGPTMRTVCGLLMHSTLAVTTEGLPLGLAAAKFWTRKNFKGTAALKRKINPTRVPIEEKESYRWLENMRQSNALLEMPERCIHVGDRESDIYELFCEAADLRTHFLVRGCVDRLAGENGHTLSVEMAKVPLAGTHTIELRDADGNRDTATLGIRFKRIRVLPPIGKQKRYPALELTVIHAQEATDPLKRKRIDWKLITDLDVWTKEDAIEKLSWYAMRWKIEVFHKILKSGCRAEDARLRTAERLVKLIAMFCIVAWRIFWMTMLNRTEPKTPPSSALTILEMRILDELIPTTGSAHTPNLSTYLIKIARLGGYLARAKDPPPGNLVMWRGLSRLTDIAIGAIIGPRLVGN